MFIILKAETEAKALRYICENISEAVVEEIEKGKGYEWWIWLADKHTPEIIKWFAKDYLNNFGAILFYSSSKVNAHV
jgi:hypothetical protein